MPDVIWQQPQSRHYRRYTNRSRYPFLVHWGNARLTTPAKMRTYVGAILVAALWMLAGRKHIWIEKRSAPETKEQQ